MNSVREVVAKWGWVYAGDAGGTPFLWEGGKGTHHLVLSTNKTRCIFLKHVSHSALAGQSTAKRHAGCAHSPLGQVFNQGASAYLREAMPNKPLSDGLPPPLYGSVSPIESTNTSQILPQLEHQQKGFPTFGVETVGTGSRLKTIRK